ncbi:major capsid hexamer protein [Mycobacterium phage Waleliano]|uniref:Major capsid hexamer protein n=7 Tax=Caudoviricetes TaxID=2731619 RepID=A0A345KWH4_9CAUD|nr:major head protein [Mycobacterium phage BrownCNA]YP_009614436.1 major head protein [Mycobacterium phage Zemanar]YP_010109555.1 major head protein [Mycobacterium phage Heath]AXH47376.1 major capsid hexamer protein [Mycobacterium phage Hangman]QBI96081.1 major capsid hexamer protein [Mycobacterium phage Waleliano]QOC58572.1 major capsid hexamer protein [Mycobacterium phage Lolalove]UVK59489.1 major capsid hexamer protein [Mycobacterium phage Austelle]AEJ95687.1 major capsid hexamer protein 
MFVSPAPRYGASTRKVGQFAHQMPQTLPETAAELAALIEGAQADINEIRARHAAGETLTGADATRLRSLLGDVDTLTAAHATAVLAEPADADEVAGLLSQADAGTAAPEAPADEAPETPEGDAGGTAPEAPADAPQVPVAASGQPAPVTNGTRPVTFGAAVTGAEPETPEGDTPTPGWVMQPGIPGYQPNARVGFAQLAKQLDTIRPGSRSVRGNRPDKYMDGQSFSAQVVSALTRDVEVVDDPHALVAAINKATSLVKGERVTAQSLTAAGGWCAPSEQLYDFCDVPDATDLLSLPEITINRGGIRWPREPDLSGIFEDFEWFFTEPELEATDPVTGAPTAVKQCVEIPCPEDFDEIRLNAVGWCVEAGILQEQGWPELIEWFMRSLTQEHLRALSRRSILNIVAGSGAAKVIPPASVLGSVASVLNSLALVATNIRLKRGLSRTATIEGIAPSWFFEVLRADLAFREGTDTFAVTDAQILGWLTARNIALQFVGDWQTRAAGLPGHMDTLKWPTTVDIVMYPAGTWFRSMSNVIELGVMYPKEQLQVNRFTRMFTEDAIAVGKRCGESALVRVPLDVNGAVGIRDTASNA